jgi:hypothetical protein
MLLRRVVGCGAIVAVVAALLVVVVAPAKPAAAAGPARFGSSIAVARNRDGRLELFGVDADQLIFHRWQTAANSSSWTGWASFEGNLSAVAAETNADGRVELFGVNISGVEFHRVQTSPGNWAGSSWVQYDGILTTIAAARNNDGRIELFGTNGGAVFHRLQTSPGSWTGSGWARFDGVLSQVAAETNSNGRVELFGVNPDGVVFHRVQTSPGNWTGSGWVVLAGPLSVILSSQAPPCSCTAPTAGLTAIANALLVRTRSVTTTVIVPAGLPVPNRTEVSILYPAAGNPRRTQNYDPVNGNRLRFDFPVGDGNTASKNVSIDLTEFAPGGAVPFHFPRTVSITPKFNVTLGPLAFTLLTDCAPVGPSSVDLGWVDDRGAKFVEINFGISGGDTRRFPEFGRTLNDVGVANHLETPVINWDGFFLLPAGIGLLPEHGSPPLLPGSSRHVDFTKADVDNDCTGRFQYDVTLTLLAYDLL